VRASQGPTPLASFHLTVTLLAGLRGIGDGQVDIENRVGFGRDYNDNSLLLL
jgi:hypothetical protein